MINHHAGRRVLMSEYTSMRVGGEADFFEPEDEAGLIECVFMCEDNGKPWFLLGNGTNVIVRDGGYHGAVISTLKALGGAEVKHDDGGTPRATSERSLLVSRYAASPTNKEDADINTYEVIAGAGESLARVCRVAAEHGLAGLEALSGIPGTVGGAVFMNAGAYGSEIADVIDCIHVYDVVDRKNIMLPKNECGFGYRRSGFREIPDIQNGGRYIILSAQLSLKPGNRDDIEARMAEYTKRRNEKQPVELPSSGSFFKRPVGDFAGRLIEAAGMKGARVGGAQVSEKHAGFIVNMGGATAADVLTLADEIKAKVYETSTVRLEEEPVVIGV